MREQIPPMYAASLRLLINVLPLQETAWKASPRGRWGGGGEQESTRTRRGGQHRSAPWCSLSCTSWSHAVWAGRHRPQRSCFQKTTFPWLPERCVCSAAPCRSAQMEQEEEQIRHKSKRFIKGDTEDYLPPTASAMFTTDLAKFFVCVVERRRCTNYTDNRRNCELWLPS